MKRSDFFTGLAMALTGVLLVAIGVTTQGRMASLLVGFGCGLLVPGLQLLWKFFYWSRPRNRARYRERLEQERIDARDELKERLRNEAGRVAYVLGLLVICVSIVIGSVLGALGVLPGARPLVLYLGAYLLFQWIAGAVIFSRLQKRYE